MAPISRRMFLVASAAIAVAACSDDGESGDTTLADSAATPAPSEPATPTTTPAGSPTTDTVTEDAPGTSATDVPTTTTAAVELPADPFTLGVASGDPDSTSVILWTRLAPDPLNGGGMPDADVPVRWELALDEAFADVVASGTELATAAHAHSIHVTATPTATAATPTTAPSSVGAMYYRFHAGGHTSAVGRTTLAPSGNVGAVSFVSASCQNYEAGFYTAHGDIAAQQPDFLVWLGDYIYEGAGSPAGTGGGTPRNHLTAEPTDLAGYRDRYALYKVDPQLQAAHRACPWFVIWDDHEVENNYAGLSPQDPTEAQAFAARRHDAYVAWWEHQPVRLDPPPETGEYRIHRAVQWGDLIGMSLLDTRQYRSDQACGDVTLNLEPACAEVFDEARTLTGTDQRDWLFSTVGTQGTTWNVIAQQVVMADITFNGAVLNFDQWDGYPAERRRILQHLADAAVPNAIVLSGDIHLAGVAVLRPGGAGVGDAVAVEFVDTSISSSGLISPDVTDLVKTFADIVDVELAHRGYTLHTVTPQTWTASYRIVESVLVPDSPVSTYRTFVVDSGTSAVRVA
jgi:alkaline phosphatase D